MSATLVPISSRPTMSSCCANTQTRPPREVSGRWVLGAGTSPRRFAFCSAQKRVMMRGEREAGTRMANMPYPQRQPDRWRTCVEMLALTKALMMNGAEVRPETRPRHLRVVISATMTDVRSCNPLWKGMVN